MRVRLKIRAVLVSKALLQTLKRKDKYKLSKHQSFDCTTISLDKEDLFSLGWIPLMLCPWSRDCLITRDWILSSIDIGQWPWWPRPHEFNNERIKVTSLPSNFRLLIQPLEQGIIKNSKAHYTWNSMEILSVLWKTTLSEKRHESRKHYIIRGMPSL